MASEGSGRNNQGVVKYDEERAYQSISVPERMARLEVKMDASAEDRSKLHGRLDEVEKNISEQIRIQTERSAYMDILKWVAALILTSVAGYFFAVLTTHVDKNTMAIEQHASPEHQR